MNEFGQSVPSEEISQIPEEEEITRLELTPELISEVMQKLQDINRDGVAFTSTPSENFDSIFNAGLLGCDHITYSRDESERKREWAADAKARKIEKSQIWFNITGRSTKSDHPLREAIYSWPGNISIIFDIGKYREITAGAHEAWDKYVELYKQQFGREPKPDSRTFSAHWAGIQSGEERIEPFEILNEETNRNVQGTRKKPSDEGFSASYRINPRLFEGIVIHREPQQDESSDVQQLVDIMLAGGMPERVVPIYDYYGNLIWPTALTHDQIVEKLSSVRVEDKNKTEDEKQLWQDKLKVALGIGTVKAIQDFEFPENISELIPDILSEDATQQQLGEIALYEILAKEQIHFGKFGDRYSAFIQKFAISQEKISQIVLADPQKFIETISLTFSDHWSLPENVSALDKLRNFLTLPQEQLANIFCSEPIMKRLFSSVRNFQDLIDLHDFLKNYTSLTSEELHERILTPDFQKFIHEKYIEQFGHKPEFARWLQNNYSIQQVELIEKSIKRVVADISGFPFRNEPKDLEEYRTIYSEQALQSSECQHLFLDHFEKNLSTCDGHGKLEQSPKQYFDLFALDYRGYFASERFSSIIIQHIKERRERDKDSDQWYEEKMSDYFNSLNNFIGEGFSFDRDHYEQVAFGHI